MNPQQIKLFQKIQEFPLDASDAIPFSQKLARENRWTIQYAQRVMDEYKKFIFIAMIAGHPVTPSDQVDQVWHLHLTYTYSYWNEFCAKVLQLPLHHHPTRGVLEDQKDYPKWYTETLTSYEKIFQQQPPADIWPLLHIRFGRGTRFTRVNSHQYWIVPKPSLSLPQLPSFVPRLPLVKLVAIALLSLILALVFFGFRSVITEIAISNHSNSSQLLPSQVTKNSSQHRDAKTSTPENIGKPASKESSQIPSSILWVVSLIVWIINSLKGNDSDGGSNNGNTSCGSGCGCGM